jgi:putative transposase
MYYISEFADEDELRQAIEKYIEYYNNGRYQERFGNLAPMEIRKAPPAQLYGRVIEEVWK